jgi:hypothetical protein
VGSACSQQELRDSYLECEAGIQAHVACYVDFITYDANQELIGIADCDAAAEVCEP